jgi:hypothetical protein
MPDKFVLAAFPQPPSETVSFAMATTPESTSLRGGSRKISVSLSGGGYRAALFSLGALLA